jgi:serine/threonine protein kinase
MELVAGKTMRALLQEGAFEPRRLIRFATQIAEALEAVHSHGVRHGDVKPENIVVQADDRIKLLDFGIASRVAEAELATATGNTTDYWASDGRMGHFGLHGTGTAPRPTHRRARRSFRARRNPL